MTAIAVGSGEMDRLQRLYDETRVDVRGPVDAIRAGFLERVVKSTSAAAKNAMIKVGLYPTTLSREILDVVPMGADKGLTAAYTNGERMGINASIVPSTPYHIDLANSLRYARGRLAEYLYERFGTQEGAEEQVMYSLGHERLHDYTQLRPIVRGDGSRAKPFRTALLEAMTDSYRRGLNGRAKVLAPLLAYLSHTPLLEGLNEVATESVYNGKSVNHVRSERTSRGVTTYDGFAAAGATALARMGYQDPMEFYSAFAHDPSGGVIRDYVSNFMGAYRGLNGSGQRAQQSMMMPVPAYATACVQAI